MRVPGSLPSRPGQPTSPWIALLALAALLPAIRLADAQAPQTLVSNIGATHDEDVVVDTFETAQGFRTGPNPDGYTLTSIEALFQVAPDGLTVKLLTGVESNSATELAILNNPASLSTGTNEFSAPANTVLSPNATYFVSFIGTAGQASATDQSAEDSGGAQGWTIAGDFYARISGSWTQPSSFALRIRVNGLAVPPTRTPVPDNFARGPVQWLGQDQHQSQDEIRASNHAFPVQLNQISANKPSNASGSLDLAPIPLSLSENPRQPSRGFYLTTTIDPPSDAPWLFRRTPEGGYAAQDAQSRRYELAPGAALLKLRLWHIYHHLGRGLNSVQLLGGSTINDRDNRLTQPLQLCLPAPDNSGNSAERARIAVRGRYDRHWTILETTLTDDGRICADTVRIAWLVVVLQPPPPSAA